MAWGAAWGAAGGESRIGRRRGTAGKRGRARCSNASVAVVIILSLFVLAVILLTTIIPQGGTTSADNVGQPFPPPFPVVNHNAAASVEEILDKGSLEMCGRALWHTLDTTTIVLPNDETFIHTGDIDDLWLRDSAGQIHPLLVPWFPGGALVSQDRRLARVISGLIRRSAFYIRHDPYANAFRIDTTYKFSEEQKRMGRHDYISTWNYELDSGCYYLRMLFFYWKAIPDAPILTEKSVFEAVSILVDLWASEQDHEGDAYPVGPLFDCQNCGRPYRYPGLARDGKGREVAKTGMTWTGFRPSDDECQFGYLVPANMFAVVALRYAAELSRTLWVNFGGGDLANRAEALATEIDAGIKDHGIVEHPTHGRIYAYEVDGLGNANLMDDANVPSLLSAPYLGYEYDSEVYANTRAFIFSADNPTYHRGYSPLTGNIEGYGSPHMGAAIRENIWPMSLAMKGLTSADTKEKIIIANQLEKASAGTGYMHESFDVSAPQKFTRSWFCWADALYAELVMSITRECPGPDHKYSVMEWRDPLHVEGGPFSAG